MALLRKFFYRKPPEGLLEISERVFVFDCCFTTNGLEDDGYNVYIGHIVDRLCEYFPEASIMVFNFGEGDQQAQVTNLLSKYNMTVIDYPRQYENCPLLTVEMIHHFLRSSESWLSLGQRNLLLLHCQMDALPVMAFTLAALLIYRKQYAGEQKTLDMMYKQAPREILRLLSPLNPLPSQLRYLQYVSRRNTGSQWPPLDGALTLDRVILRCIPDMHREGGCRPIIRIYGHDPLMVVDRTTKVLFSMPQTNKAVRQLKRADCEVKIDIHCHVQGDVVLECITLDDNLKLENMMFRVMFNTAFIGSNVLILTPDEIDTPWNVKDQFPEDFRAEVLFSEMNSLSSLVGLDLPGIEYEDLPVEAFVEVHDALNNSDLLVPNSVQKDKFSGDAHGDRGFLKESPSMVVVETPKSEVFENETMISLQIAINETHSTLSKSSLDKSLQTSEIKKRELQVVVQRPAKCKVIPQRASPTSISSPALFSNSFQCAPIAISRYHGATSALGITALLHDHAEFNKEASYSSKPSAPEQTILGKQSNNSETRKDSTPLPPPPPPPPPPPHPLFRSTRSLHPPVSPSVPQSPPSLLSLEVPPVSPRPLSSPSLPATCQIHHSKSSGIHSSLASSSLLLQLRQESPPLQSLVRVSVPPPPPSPAPSQSKSYLSVPVLPSIQFGLDCKMSAHIRQQLPMPHLPPPPPLCIAYNTSLSSSGKSFSPTPDSSPSCFSEMASTPRIDQSQVVFPTNRPRPLMPNSYSRNQSSGPPPHSSSVKKALPSFQSTSSASPPPPPPPPPFSGKAKSPSLLSFPLPPPPSATSTSPSSKILQPVAPPPSCIKETASLPFIRDLSLASPVSTPALPSSIGPTIHNLSIIVPSPTALLPGDSASISCQDSSLVPEKLSVVLLTLPTPPPPPCSRLATVSSGSFTAPPAPTPQSSGQKEASVINCQTVPPPPAPLSNGLSKSGTTPLQSRSSVGGGNIPTPPVGVKGKFQLRASGRVHNLAKKTSLKPYHWLKLTRAMYGSIWAEAQKPEEASKAPELDMSELESLFSATVSNSDLGGAIGKTSGRASGLKSEKVHLIELRRAYNCEIMLTKVKVPLSDLMNSILALDDSKLDIDQVDNLIKFCPTKEEMELLKNYSGNQENLGKCEQFFLELMKVPRAESKLRIFSFKIQFHSQVSDLRNCLNIVNSASGEVRNSVKLKRIMQTILSLGNALNHGTARGSAVGFRLDSLLKLTETRSINKKLTLMHYLCKVLAEKLPEVIDFQKDLVSLEAATKIQLKYLAEEMQAISKGLEKVAQELSASENDGLVSKNFYKTLKDFLEFGEAEVRSLASLYSGVGKNADALAFYFGEDPVRCPFEQVVSTLLNFVRMFLRSHNENCKQLEYEKKKALKEAETIKDKSNSFTRPESENMNLNT